jgi:hypothetical protein
MPNKYEREIEEILRNMDRTDQGQSLGERLRGLNRPSPRPRPAGPRIRLRLGVVEAFLLVGVALALVGGGISFYFGVPESGLAATIGGALGAAALVCFITGLIIGWRVRFRGYSMPTWRGQSVDRPRRRSFNPFAPIVTRFRIMRLKWRYLRHPGH